MISRRYIYIILSLLLIAILISVWYISHKQEGGGIASMFSSRDLHSATVSGTSMEPLLHDGQEISYDTRAYQGDGASSSSLSSSLPQRTDIAIITVGGKDIVKRVLALPGDHWSYSGGYIIVNDTIMKTSEGDPYFILGSRMLEIYSRDYPLIPPDTYLIMGNRKDGTYDATHFGLVNGSQLVGKVILSGKE